MGRATTFPLRILPLGKTTVTAWPGSQKSLSTIDWPIFFCEIITVKFLMGPTIIIASTFYIFMEDRLK